MQALRYAKGSVKDCIARLSLDDCVWALEKSKKDKNKPKGAVEKKEDKPKPKGVKKG